ncbi:hypothetical protein KIN20_009340 [Parelaphostrongylus tenuis]|uniref:Large ribosomal subunit protein P2 n=1 Tax=Parelaphostrongylus tenuis TaxID=148309 RepID=A0AAD5QJI9_PARTN|nr:hypothetical protein KIN20_009340 [Parelaphostrongylus tenuis]
MRYVSAYLLALAGGNRTPKVEDIKNILGAVGVDTDVEAANLVISRLQGKSIDQVIAEGAVDLVTVSGGVPAVSAASVAAPDATSAAPAAAAEAKPAKKEEKEESDDDLGFGLFD